MIPVLYCEQMVANSGHAVSPSAHKPKLLINALQGEGRPIKLVQPQPVTSEDLYLAHDVKFVDGVMSCKLPNGFGNCEPSVAMSLPYTSGAMYSAAVVATPRIPACAPVSGFHHACYDKAMGFCTFNGLMVAAAKLIADQHRVAIIDCDMHYGNGTDDISFRWPPERNENLFHLTMGERYKHRMQHTSYLSYLRSAMSMLSSFRPSVILYQAGADVHIDDPHGGLLTTEEMIERDHIVFTGARTMQVPICWNLAGGYQLDPDGGCSKVIKLHLNTFDVVQEVYKIQ